MIFFGASTGRTATMHLANVLNAERNSLCLHEGKFRNREESGEQLLPFLTLENRIGYEYPERCADIVREKRSPVKELAGKYACFGDIAYNNSSFLNALADEFEDARFLVLFRDGRTFVRSAALADDEDEVPAGWAPNKKQLTQMERYISLGRWQPRKDSEFQQAWSDWDYFEKNIWLWSETNRVLLDSLEKLPEQRYLKVKFEDFISDKQEIYSKIRRFLGFDGEMPEEVKQVLLSKRINPRHEYTIPEYSDWAESEKNFFWNVAGPTMTRLGYGK